MSESGVTVGVVGLGYWGPNLARNFARLPDCRLSWCCDRSPAARERFGTADVRMADGDTYHFATTR